MVGTVRAVPVESVQMPYRWISRVIEERWRGKEKEMVVQGGVRSSPWEIQPGQLNSMATDKSYIIAKRTDERLCQKPRLLITQISFKCSSNLQVQSPEYALFEIIS